MRTIRPAGAMSSVSVQLGMDPVCPPAVRARCLQSDGEGLPTSSLGVARLEELMSPPLERNSSTVLKPTNDYAVQDWSPSCASCGETDCHLAFLIAEESDGVLLSCR